MRVVVAHSLTPIVEQFSPSIGIKRIHLRPLSPLLHLSRSILNHIRKCFITVHEPALQTVQDDLRVLTRIIIVVQIISLLLNLQLLSQLSELLPVCHKTLLDHEDELLDGMCMIVKGRLFSNHYKTTTTT